MPSHSPRRLGTLPRLAAAAAATAATLTLGAGLLGAFHAAAPPQWLPASPDVLAELARCDGRPGRADREQCRQRVALQRLEPANAEVRLAAGDPAPHAAYRGRP
jgi:hypothetical protein